MNCEHKELKDICKFYSNGECADSLWGIPLCEGYFKNEQAASCKECLNIINRIENYMARREENN